MYTMRRFQQCPLVNWKVSAGIAVALLAAATPSLAADDFKVMKLEQDVRNLERQVQDLQRQLADLRQRTRTSAEPRTSAAPEAMTPPNDRWLDAGNWKKIRPGMNEMEVISLLGPPTTLRGAADSASRTLMYALEIGSSGFLSGSVQLENRVVVEVSVPVLR